WGRDVCSQQSLGAPKVAFLNGLVGRADVRGVQVLARNLVCLIDPISDQRRTDRQNKQEYQSQRARRSKRRIAAAPTPDAFDTGYGPRVDWFVAEKTSHFIGQLLRGDVTFGGFPVQTFETNRFKIGRHRRIEKAWRNRIRVEHLLERVCKRVAHER